MAEPSAPRAKLCPDCGREVCCGQATAPDAATLDCHGGAQCIRLAYAREKAAREKAEAAYARIRAGIKYWFNDGAAASIERSAAAEARAANLEELLRRARDYVPRLGVNNLCARIDAALPPEAG